MTGSNGEATANDCFTSARQHHTVVAKIKKTRDPHKEMTVPHRMDRIEGRVMPVNSFVIHGPRRASSW